MNPSRLLDLFFEIVRIESPSRFESAMAQRCKQELEDLGFSVRFDKTEDQTGSDTGNLIACREGELGGQIVLSAHMDTVQPCQGIEPVVIDGVIRSAGDTILSADDKAGIAGIFEGVRSLIEANEKLPTITILLTVCEELSLLGAGALGNDELPAGAPCYVFDADGAPGTIILGSPCHYTLHANFKGRAAHAGVEPEVGISAISMAAAAINAMNLGRIDEATTANIGVIQGGRESNIVADSCSLLGECRSLYSDRVELVRANIEDSLLQAAKQFGGSVDIEWRKDYDALLYKEEDSFVQAIAQAARLAGLEPSYRYSGGGADANMLSSRGVQSITLGIGMTNFHAITEYITVADLEGIARFVEELVRQAAQS